MHVCECASGRPKKSKQGKEQTSSAPYRALPYDICGRVGNGDRGNRDKARHVLISRMKTVPAQLKSAMEVVMAFPMIFSHLA